MIKLFPKKKKRKFSMQFFKVKGRVYFWKLTKTIILTWCIPTNVYNNQPVKIGAQLVIEVAENTERQNPVLSVFRLKFLGEKLPLSLKPHNFKAGCF